LRDLRNMRLGLWDSYVTRGDDGQVDMYPLMKHLKTCLDEEEAGISFVWDRRPNIARPARVEVLEKFATKIDAAVVGECASGSSVYATVQDAVRLETIGVPTITICHHQLAEAAEDHAAQLGLPGLRFLIEEASAGGVVQSERTMDCATIVAEVTSALSDGALGQ
jgi:hypothetical protein